MQDSLVKNGSRLNEILRIKRQKIQNDEDNKPQHDFISIYTVMQSTHTMFGGSILSTIQDPTLPNHDFQIGGQYEIESVVGNKYSRDSFF